MNCKGVFLGSIVSAFLLGCATSDMGRPAAAVTGSASSLPASESAFAQDACQGGAVQVQMSQLAMANTRNKEVRAFAKRLAEDHGQAAKELNRIFSRNHIAGETDLDPTYQTTVDDLEHLKGGAFDQAFKDRVIRGHQMAIGAFERQAREGTSAELRAFAEKQLPHLREHLETARNLRVSTDADGPAGDSHLGGSLANPVVRGAFPGR